MVMVLPTEACHRAGPIGTVLGYASTVSEEPHVASRFTGYTLEGKYYLEEVIAEGGMGVVVAARHLVLGERVAVKLLRPNLFDREESSRRVLREAQAMARLRSQHIARILDAGTGPSGAPYLVMELLSGEDLGALLRRRGPLPAVEVCQLVAEACDGLAEAHASGVIHRDLKPSNLFLATTPDGTQLVKVLDFGISKVASVPGEATLTTHDALLGSPPYMSPEQAREPHTVDALADVWSLGAILFRLLTGEHAFAETSTHEVLVAVLRDEPRRLRAVMPEASPRLEAIVTTCMQRDPSLRYASVSLLADDLRAYRRGLLAGLEVSSSGGGTAGAARPARERWLRPALLGLGGSAALLSIVAIAAYPRAPDEAVPAPVPARSVESPPPVDPPPPGTSVVASQAALPIGAALPEEPSGSSGVPSASATSRAPGVLRSGSQAATGVAPLSPPAVPSLDAYEDRL